MSTVNIQEKIGKIVGKRVGIRHPLTPQQGGKAQRVAWRKAFNTPFIPKGVYRFRSHEEADTWTLKMLTRIRPS